MEKPSPSWFAAPVSVNICIMFASHILQHVHACSWSRGACCVVHAHFSGVLSLQAEEEENRLSYSF